MNTLTKNLLIAPATLATLASCTGQLPGSFSLQPQTQVFTASQEINTKVDILWVVDNSSSMDTAQQKLRNGFAAFSRKYLLPTWDIRVAVITSDLYMANSAYTAYLNTTLGGTTGWNSPYINSRLGTFVNPTSNPSLVNLATGTFDSGVKVTDLVPSWGPNYARLLPGMHDGPITALCVDYLMPYFYGGTTNCSIRDDQSAHTGTSQCLNPTGGNSGITQCVNTVQNDTVRSGKAIIETTPPAGTAADAAWTQSLVDAFTVNVSTGASGMGSERGLGSVLQLIADNENTATAFFRAGSTRAIIFVTDEDDQTVQIPATVPTPYTPWTGYSCDQDSLVALNGGAAITGMNGYCCDTVGNNCTFGANGTSCPSKVIDGYTYTPSLCADASKVVAVSEVKTQLDTFFQNLDGGTGSPNYFVNVITPLTAASIQELQVLRDADDTAAGVVKTTSTDRGDRYIELGTLVGNGSGSMDIAEDDYSGILDSIGRTIIEKAGTFTLERAPTGEEEVVLKVVHADGSSTVIDRSKYSISGLTITIDDVDTILTFAAGDHISIFYQPSTVY